MAKKIVSIISILLVAILTLTSCNNSASKIDLEVIAGLDADYYIDYKNGTIPIGDLSIGARVVDPSWEWEFRTGNNYSGSGEVKPVTWIIVAKDHYDGLEPHVTLLSEELIGLYAFDNSTNRGSQYGSHHWGKNGTGNATHGLRPWLNSTGIHAGEGFYLAFSEAFKGSVLTTTVPNKEWPKGTTYSTEDHVFIPSTTELGAVENNYTYRIGDVYAYFTGAGDAKRVARIGGEAKWYRTRSPDSSDGYHVRNVNYDGEFIYYFANNDNFGVRPALNLKSGILVSETKG